MENSKNEFNEKPKSSLVKVLDIISTMASRPSGFIGLTILIFHVTLAITSPWFAPYDYKAINPSLMLNAPSLDYWFGTDSLGRDVFTRTILGGRTALIITFFGSIIALLWGGLLGIFCGLVGGRIDDVVMRIVDAFLSIPWILAMANIQGIDKNASTILITTSSILPPTKPQKIPKRPPHKRAIIDPKKVIMRAVLPPKIVLVKTSLPKLSVPNQ